VAIVSSGLLSAQSLAPYTPLNSSERWHEFWNDTFASPYFYAGALASSANSHIAYDPPEWRLGVAGYAERSAWWLGVFTIQETVHQGSAAMLGYDPRYLRCRCRGFLPRASHAFKWSLLTKNSSGKTRLDLPVLAGAYGGGMLAMYAYPDRYQPLKDGVRIGNQQMVFVVGFNLIDEFGPELKRFFTFH